MTPSLAGSHFPKVRSGQKIRRQVSTAKLCELDPEADLRYVLERIADHPINRIEELLRWNAAAKLKPLQLAA